MSDMTYEQVIEAVKALPPERLTSAYDFIRYLSQTDVPNFLVATEEDMAAEDEAWNAMIAATSDQLDKFVVQAMSEGGTTGIAIEGEELVPSPTDSDER